MISIEELVHPESGINQSDYQQHKSAGWLLDPVSQFDPLPEYLTVLQRRWAIRKPSEAPASGAWRLGDWPITASFWPWSVGAHVYHQSRIFLGVIILRKSCMWDMRTVSGTNESPCFLSTPQASQSPCLERGSMRHFGLHVGEATWLWDRPIKTTVVVLSHGTRAWK